MVPIPKALPRSWHYSMLFSETYLKRRDIFLRYIRQGFIHPRFSNSTQRRSHVLNQPVRITYVQRHSENLSPVVYLPLIFSSIRIKNRNKRINKVEVKRDFVFSSGSVAKELTDENPHNKWLMPWKHSILIIASYCSKKFQENNATGKK